MAVIRTFLNYFLERDVREMQARQRHGTWMTGWSGHGVHGPWCSMNSPFPPCLPFAKIDADIQQGHQGRVRTCRRCHVDVERKFAEAMARARHGVA